MSATDRDLRLQLWTTGLLVLFALSAAGLAVAADRPHDSRSELFHVAEQRWGPWIDSAWAELRSVSDAMGELSELGRDAIEGLQALDTETVPGRLSRGDDLADGLANQVTNANGPLGGATFEQIERWRLSPDRQAQLEAVDAAVAAARTVPGEWRRIATTAGTMSGGLLALLRHDDLVFRATSAARQSQWAEALELLDQAAADLDAAAVSRDALSAQGDVETLAELLDGYAARDAALANLYTFLRDGGQQSGAQFETLRADVDRAQEALSGSDDVLAEVVAESAAPAITAALIAIEEARGEVSRALATAPQPAP